MLAQLLLLAAAYQPQPQFELATIKPTPLDWRGGRFTRMTSPQRFVATNFSLRALIAAAFKLNPRAVLGGPSWIDFDRYDIVGLVPGDQISPGVFRQMTMLRHLLVERFGLVFHREEKEMALYVLSVAKNGPKLKESTAPPDQDPRIVNVIFPDHIELPATADSSQFDGLVPEHSESTKPGFFTAIQQQIGLKLEASKGPVLAFAIDKIQRPTEN